MKNTIKRIRNQLTVSAVLMTAPTMALASAEFNTGNSRGFLELLKDVKDLLDFGGQAAYSAAMLGGICLFIGGVIAIMAAGKTNDPSKTKTGGISVMILGIILGSAGAFMNMGSTTITGTNSEYNEFYTEHKE